MRFYINKALARVNCDGLLAKRSAYDRLSHDASLWLRARPLLDAASQPSNCSDEYLGALRNVDALQSQFGQDAFVLSQLSFKKGGYFVDFGATDGITGNNSYILEKQYGWTGILAEPARCWHESLLHSRSAHIELSCVAPKSGTVVSFYEKGVFSSIRAHISVSHKLKRLTKPRRFYNVPSISLLDLLRKYNAPNVIDYLSLDTEGSELDILSAFDFSAYKFRVITCEHNYSARREPIFALLTSRGYKRVCEAISEADDWYILEPQHPTS